MPPTEGRYGPIPTVDWPTRLVMSLAAIILTARGALSGWYLALRINEPWDNYFLESKFSWLARRVRDGEPLYPPFKDGPYEPNYYGPLYFWLVGWISRLWPTDEFIIVVGRWVSVGAVLSTSILLAIVVGRSLSRTSGLIAGWASLAGAPLIGFSVMVRPDALAELLALGGFFAALSSMGGSAALAVSLFLLATLTKQTTGIFLVCALLSLGMRGEWRRAGAIGMAFSLGLLVVVAGATLAYEPMMAQCFAADQGTAWTIEQGTTMLARMARRAPEFLLAPLVVCWRAWEAKRQGESETRQRLWRDLALLAMLLLFSGGATACKTGSDLNYFLSLRLIFGLAWGGWWSLARSSRSRLVWGIVLLLATIQGTRWLMGNNVRIQGERQQLTSELGQKILAEREWLEAQARRPNSRLLADSPRLCFRQKQPPFIDPFLFKILVESKQVHPQALINRIERQEYDLVVLSAALDGDDYDAYAFGLPRSVADAVRRRYVKMGTFGGYFLYEPAH